MKNPALLKVGITAISAIDILLSIKIARHNAVYEKGTEGTTDAYLEAAQDTADIRNEHINRIQQVRDYHVQ